MLILVNNNLVDSNSQQSTVNSQQSTCKNFKLFQKLYIRKVDKIFVYSNLSLLGYLNFLFWVCRL